ncbi:MAG: YvcK family protein, partial [Parcubacteria group bacterium]|nr:YvcK family protein [Parcubacteria group bacterium]
TNIDVPTHNGQKRIRRIWLKPKARASREAIRAIKNADAVVIGPGDLFTSLVPNLLVGGVSEAIKKSRAKKMYICNVMTKFGETHGFQASDFLHVLERYVGKRALDYLVVNTGRPSREVLRRYIREKAFPVEVDEGLLQGRAKPVLVKAKLLRGGALVRHDPDKLAKLINLLV